VRPFVGCTTAQSQFQLQLNGSAILPPYIGTLPNERVGCAAANGLLRRSKERSDARLRAAVAVAEEGPWAGLSKE